MVGTSNVAGVRQSTVYIFWKLTWILVASEDIKILDANYINILTEISDFCLYNWSKSIVICMKLFIGEQFESASA
jgi:predicted deacetylase